MLVKSKVSSRKKKHPWAKLPRSGSCAWGNNIEISVEKLIASLSEIFTSDITPTACQLVVTSHLAQANKHSSSSILLFSGSLSGKCPLMRAKRFDVEFDIMLLHENELLDCVLQSVLSVTNSADECTKVQSTLS